jgi:hypothetical protein
MRRLLDRRHRDLALDIPLRMARDRHELVPECKALVLDDDRPAGGAEGLSGSEGYGPDPEAVICSGASDQITAFASELGGPGPVA